MSTNRSSMRSCAPRTSPKRPRACRKSTSTCSKWRTTATKADVKAGRGAAVQRQGRGGQRAEREGQEQDLPLPRRPPRRLAQSIRSPGRRPDDRRDGQGLRQRTMALMNFKPTSPGRRSMVARRPPPACTRARPHARADREQAEDRRSQQQRPDHHPPHRWWPQAALSHDRFQARQGRHPRQGRAHRIRSEPHRAHRAAVLRRWRAPLHHRAQGHDASATSSMSGRTRRSRSATRCRCATCRSARTVHCIEMKPGKGAQIARSAGAGPS